MKLQQFIYHNIQQNTIQKDNLILKSTSSIYHHITQNKYHPTQINIQSNHHYVWQKISNESIVEHLPPPCLSSRIFLAWKI